MNPYEPDDLGRFEVFQNSNQCDYPRVFVGQATLRYLDLQAGDRIHVFPIQEDDAVSVATADYAEGLRGGDNPVPELCSHKVTKPASANMPRAYLTSQGIAFLGAEIGDIIRMEYGARGRYAIARRTELDSKTDPDP